MLPIDLFADFRPSFSRSRFSHSSFTAFPPLLMGQRFHLTPALNRGRHSWWAMPPCAHCSTVDVDWTGNSGCCWVLQRNLSYTPFVFGDRHRPVCSCKDLFHIVPVRFWSKTIRKPKQVVGAVLKNLPSCCKRSPCIYLTHSLCFFYAT